MSLQKHIISDSILHSQGFRLRIDKHSIEFKGNISLVSNLQNEFNQLRYLARLKKMICTGWSCYLSLIILFKHLSPAEPGRKPLVAAGSHSAVQPYLRKSQNTLVSVRGRSMREKLGE